MQVPYDPVWAPDGALRRLRRTLRDYDPRLGVAWNMRRHRWAIYQQNRRNSLSHVFDLTGPNGEYRHPDSCPDWILKRLDRMAWWKRMADTKTEFITNMHRIEDEYHAKQEAAREAEREYLFKSVVGDIAERAWGVRKTIGPADGKIRHGRQDSHRRAMREASESLKRVSHRAPD